MSRYDLNGLELLTPAYLDDLGLSEPPFAPEHDARFFYLDEIRAQHLELIRHLFRQRELLLVVNGPATSGKTALAQHLAETLSAHWQCCAISADPLFGPQEVLIRIAQGFGLNPHAAASELAGRVGEQLASVHDRGRVPILLVDDAHALAPDALEAVLRLADHVGPGGGQLLRTVLFSEVTLDNLLDTPSLKALRPSVTHTLAMPVLDEVETGRYLEHRLRVAGLRNESPFADAAVRRIRRRSGGIPGRINVHAHRWLSRARGGPDLSRLLPTHLPHGRAALGGGLMVLLLIAAWAGLAGDDDARHTIALPVTIEDTPPAQTEVAQGVPPAQVFTVPDNETTFGDTPRHALESAENQLIATDPVSAPTPVRAPREEPTPDSTSAETTAPTAPAEPVAAKASAAKRDGGPETDSGSAPTPGRAAEAPPGEPTPDPPLADNTADTTPPPVAAHTRPARLHDESWVKARAPDHYTLQLFATVNQTRITDFVERHPLQGRAAYFRTREDEGDLYHLVLGDHATRTQAETAVQLLPESLRSITPWVRPFAAIQGQIAQTQTGDVEPKSPPLQSTRVNSTPISASASAAWLWDQDPRHFTLQLLGTGSEERLQAFIREHGLGGEVAYFRTRRDNQDWFVLVHGSYPDRDQAKAARAELPGGLRAAKPWPRSFAGLHAEVRSPTP